MDGAGVGQDRGDVAGGGVGEDQVGGDGAAGFAMAGRHRGGVESEGEGECAVVARLQRKVVGRQWPQVDRLAGDRPVAAFGGWLESDADGDVVGSQRAGAVGGVEGAGSHHPLLRGGVVGGGGGDGGCEVCDRGSGAAWGGEDGCGQKR